MKPIPISLRQIDYILGVAATGSTAEASRLLHVSQPSISLAITRCEEIFGQKLFVRIAGRGMELTAFGKRKVAELRGLDKQIRSILSAEGDAAARLDLGVFSTLGPRYGPKLVRSFLNSVPNADVHIHEGDLQSLYGWLAEGRIDVALIYDFGAPRDLEIVSLQEITPYALFPKTHWLSHKSEVHAAELQDEPIILINLPHSREFFLSILQACGKTVEIAHETNSVEMLRSMVANNFGIGLLATDTACNKAYDGGPLSTATLRGQLPTHRIALASPKEIQRRPIVELFVSHTKAHFEINMKP